MATDGNESDIEQQIQRMHIAPAPSARQASAPAAASDSAAAGQGAGHHDPAAPASATAGEVGGREGGGAVRHG